MQVCQYKGGDADRAPSEPQAVPSQATGALDLKSAQVPASLKQVRFIPPDH